MHNQNNHPTLKEPPIAHALHQWDEANRTLTYEYNGRNIIALHIPGDKEAGFRHGSDGNLQSRPFMQQIYVSLDETVTAEMRILLSADAINMRPHRAWSGQAILGQMGRPLIQGVNGMYDVDQDFLISWNGCDWQWLTEHMEVNEKGELFARLSLELGPKPMFINLAMQYYRKHLGYSCHKPWEWQPKRKPVAGWCSWEAYRRNISIEDLESTVKSLAKKFKPYGMEYIQLDDGYQRMPIPYEGNITLEQGWCTTDEDKFPGGHKRIVDTIKAQGFVPGIWTNSNINNKAFAENHRKNLITKSDGEPLLGEWIDYLYNCEADTLLEMVEPIFKGFREKGYSYIKIDALRHLLFDGLGEAVRLGLITNDECEEKYRNYLEACRRGMGEASYFLASWGEISEAIGLVDACRISMDANPTWAGIRMQIVETARWFHAQRILFLIDPDHVCARTDIEWARSILSLISLSGGLYMLSDVTSVYEGERSDIIRRTLPPLQTITGETGALDTSYPAFTWTKLHGFAVHKNEKPIAAEEVSAEDAYNMAGNYPTMNDNHPFGSLWAIHLNQYGRKWCVLGRFATVALKESRIDMEALGLSKSEEYLCFDFWKQQYLGKALGELFCPALKLGNCQVISLTKGKETPQIIASSRHVSMDAVSVDSQTWKDTALSLRINGVIGTAETYWFHKPAKYRLVGKEAAGALCNIRCDNEILKVDITFFETSCNIKMKFEETAAVLHDLCPESIRKAGFW